MSIFGRLFASDKAVDNILDKEKGLLVRAGGWVNGLHYTEQEKAENAHMVRNWGLRQLEALEPFKVVQRILAFAVAGQWILVGINVIGAIWYDAARGCTEAVETCTPVVPPMLQFAFSDFIFWPVLAVLSLYFTGGVLPGVFNGGKKPGG